MAGSGSGPTESYAGQSTPLRARSRKIPDWVVVVVGVVGVIGAGVLGNEIGAYYISHTTVTVSIISWGLPSMNGSVYAWAVECQQEACPTQAHPGSTYTGSIFLSGFWGTGGNVTLTTPAPFTLVSTEPTLPAVLPAGGLTISIELKLPSAAGTYSFTGQVQVS
jgi:hypothetical protein